MPPPRAWSSSTRPWRASTGPKAIRSRIESRSGPAPARPLLKAPRQVVGIVGDTHDGGPNRDPFPMMYIPLAQMPDLETALNSRVAPLWWIVRSQVDPHTLVTPITAALREASGGLPVAHIRTMDEIEARNTARQRFNMLLLTVFGSAGLLMAAIGVYGVMSYSVQQRTQELGVRMALGAQASNLRNMVIRQGMTLTLIGVVIGIGGAFWLTRFLASFLFGVKPWIRSLSSATPLLLSAVALLVDLDSRKTRDSRRPHDCASARVKRLPVVIARANNVSYLCPEIAAMNRFACSTSNTVKRRRGCRGRSTSSAGFVEGASNVPPAATPRKGPRACNELFVADSFRFSSSL